MSDDNVTPISRAQRRARTSEDFSSIYGDLGFYRKQIQCAAIVLDKAEDDGALDESAASAAIHVLTVAVDDLEKIESRLDAWHTAHTTAAPIAQEDADDD